MSNVRKYANGIARSGLLGAGLLGLYLYQKKSVPEYIGIVSCCITCVSLYALVTYMLDDESEGKDKGTPKPETTNVAETPTSKKKLATARRMSSGLPSNEACNVDLTASLVAEERKLNKAKPKNLPKVIKLPNPDIISQNAKESLDLLKLGELSEIKEDTITIRTSPLQMKKVVFKNPVANSGVEPAQNWDDLMIELLENEVSLEEPLSKTG